VWCVREDGRLQSVLYDDVWEPGHGLTATCASGHLAPDAACACGIYAAREPGEALRYLVGRDELHVVGRVLGRVALWGTVVEGERGWRASRAYPADLDSQAISFLYGLPFAGYSARRSFEEGRNSWDAELSTLRLP
jgi:hypothetical protein